MRQPSFCMVEPRDCESEVEARNVVESDQSCRLLTKRAQTCGSKRFQHRPGSSVGKDRSQEEAPLMSQI
jgi:hypothetical protein